jgi:flavin-dependent dehydrogenase
VRRVGVFANDVQLAATMPTTANAPDPWGRALGREHLDLLLLQAAARAGATIRQPAKVTALRRDDVGFVAAAAAKETVTEVAARLVIAANGSWERPPAPLPALPGHRASDLLAFKAHFRQCDLATDLMPLIVFPGGYGGMVHSDGGRVTLSCCVRRDQLQQCREQHATPHAAEAVLRHIERSCAGVRRALKHATLDDAWLSAGPIRTGLRRRYADGIFFVGNAAGEAHPVVAEGISMAMQSAWLLCRQLVARRPMTEPHQIDTAGRAYDAEWKAAFVPRIAAAAAFAHGAMRPGVVAPLLPLLKLFPQILTFGARLSGKSTQVVTVAS